MTAALGTLAAGAIDAFGFASPEPSFLRRGFHAFIRLPGQTPPQAKPIMFASVSPGYFDVLRIPIVTGRDFQPADATRPVALINEAMAREYWPNENPIGKTFVTSGGINGLIRPNDRSTVLEVVGVIRNAHTNGLYEVSPTFYQPLATSGARLVPKLLVRTSGPMPTDDLARLVQRIDPRVRTQTIALSAILQDRMQETRTGPMLAGVLGACALALATVGMFGVFAYAVRQRSREIGIRMALGAQPAAVVRLVLAGHSRAVVRRPRRRTGGRCRRLDDSAQPSARPQSLRSRLVPRRRGDPHRRRPRGQLYPRPPRHARRSRRRLARGVARLRGFGV